MLHRPIETTPFFGGTHAAIASSLSQIVTSPRLLRPRSYSLQFRILYFFLYWRLTRLDFAATTMLPPPPDLYDGLDPTPAASVLAYTDSCTNAHQVDRCSSAQAEKTLHGGTVYDRHIKG